MSELAQAVDRGIVQVHPAAGGYEVTGAVNDMLISTELEQLGGVYKHKAALWFVSDDAAAFSAGMGEAVANDFTKLTRRTQVVQAAAAARAGKVATDGVNTFDKQRAALQRRITRELKGVYSAAILDHSKQLNELQLIADSGTLSPDEALLLAYRRGELNSIIDELSRGLANAGASAERATSATLPNAASTGYALGAWQIQNTTGVNLTRFIAHDTAALALHSKYDKIAWASVANRRAAETQLRNAVSRGLLTGEHPEKIAQRVDDTFNQWSRRAVTIARTETARIMSEAAQESLREAEAEGIKVMNKWVATLDSHTRKTHRRQDGVIRPVGERFPNGARRPGDGGAAESINCRCCLVPVLEGFTPDYDYRRDNVARKNIPYVSYDEWARGAGGGAMK